MRTGAKILAGICLAAALDGGRAGDAAAAKLIPGPVPAEIVEVVDGDTVDVRAPIWPGIVAEARVRLEGLDTPELRGKCAAEREAAQAARAALVALLATGEVMLRDIRPGKYAGRVVARVETAAGRDAAAALIAAGHGRAYDGRSARAGWCGANPTAGR